MSASGCKCGCASEFVRYVSSMRDALAREIGVEEMCREGGWPSRDIVEDYATNGTSMEFGYQ